MRVAIVDDEIIFRKQIQQALAEILDIQRYTIEMFESGDDLINSQRKFDIVLMDIEMPGINGFEAARRYKMIEPESIIIILTTHSELMEYGYMVNVFRYIEKSRIEERLSEAIRSGIKLINRKRKVSLGLKGYGEVSIPVKSIIYIETVNRKTIIHTAKESFTCTEKMDVIEQKLEDKGFFGCHRGIVISLDNVVDYDNYSIRMSNNDMVLLSVRKVKPFKDAYMKRKFEYANS